jgi:low-density lipoprotein receptor class B
MKTETSKPKSAASGNKNATGRLYFLEASGGRIHSANADGSDRKVIVTGCRIPDGIVVNVQAAGMKCCTN